MYYMVKTTSDRIIHTPECPHLRRTSENNLVGFETALLANKHGYRFCKHCNPLAPFYRAEENVILDFSRMNGISVHLGSRFIIVKSPRSRWLITLEDESQLVLFHKNTEDRETTAEPEVNGYHRQRDILSSTIEQYLAYIVEHDYYRMCNPLVVKAKREPARKGTKRYKKQMKYEKRLEKRRKANNVLQLLAAIQE